MVLTLSRGTITIEHIIIKLIMYEQLKVEYQEVKQKHSCLLEASQRIQALEDELDLVRRGNFSKKKKQFF